MNTPITDFLQEYENEHMIRFHMPGHKGEAVLGCEALDITEVRGADALYEASGIIGESEGNASLLFGSQRTCYSTEGSSQCIRAMLYLALTHSSCHTRPVVVAARNVHKSFVYAAAMLDFDVVWLWPEEQRSLCGCPVSPKQVEQVLSCLDSPPAAVYLTSPDYLGGMADLSALAEVVHRHGSILVVDNAHGAYLRFLKPSLHPLDLGADLCCDSAHKTLPVLTGGAYLHISKQLPKVYADHAKAALELFGSTSPSYLTMASLDLCNRYLAEIAPQRLAQRVEELHSIKTRLKLANWQLEESDPLRITICAPEGETGKSLADRLWTEQIACEYADDTHLVLMVSTENTTEELERFLSVLGENHAAKRKIRPLPTARSKQVVSIRQALFARHELIPTDKALGRICGAPTVSCPPAIPIAVFGEQITEEMLELFRYYDVREIDVLK